MKNFLSRIGLVICILILLSPISSAQVSTIPSVLCEYSYENKTARVTYNAGERAAYVEMETRDEWEISGVDISNVEISSPASGTTPVTATLVSASVMTSAQVVGVPYPTSAITKAMSVEGSESTTVTLKFRIWWNTTSGRAVRWYQGDHSSIVETGCEIQDSVPIDFPGPQAWLEIDFDYPENAIPGAPFDVTAVLSNTGLASAEGITTSVYFSSWQGQGSWVECTGLGCEDLGYDKRLTKFIESLGAGEQITYTFQAVLLHGAVGPQTSDTTFSVWGSNVEVVLGANQIEVSPAEAIYLPLVLKD